MNKKVSVVVPIYNQEPYLAKCLDSLLAQSFTHCELVLVDDGSTDKSGEILAAYGARDERIQIITTENGGVSKARNLGLHAATGEWIAFVDPDDEMAVDYLARLVELATEDVDIVSCCCQAFDEDIREVDRFFPQDILAHTLEEKAELYKQLFAYSYGHPGTAYTGIGVPWAKLYRRQMLLDQGVDFCTQLVRDEDNDFNLRAFYYAKGIRYVNEPLYFYRLAHLRRMARNHDERRLRSTMLLAARRHQAWVDFSLDTLPGVEPFYYGEMLKLFSQVMNRGIFHPKNGYTRAKRKELKKELLEMPCFQALVGKVRYQDLKKPYHSFVRRIYYWITWKLFI